MLESITPFADRLGMDPRALILVGLFIGCLLFFVSLVSVARDRSADRVAARMRAAQGAQAEVISLFLAPDADPKGLAKAFLPAHRVERNKVRRDLALAGFRGPNAVVYYYLLRVGAGLVLPAVLALIFVYRDVIPLPEVVSDRLGRLNSRSMLYLFAVLILVGFYGPALWLRSRAGERRHKIEMAFPNALDLLQVSVETGLGFDAAMGRVAQEMQSSGPEVSLEMDTAQQEILAGRSREDAYRAMAERLGIDEAYAFTNVVLQSIRFGTSMSQALLTYSAEMRQRRELKAQEKANKLPVLMSGVMAALMMPALLIVTIGPVFLRYVETFPK
jgi:tight adherence protein C